MGATPSQILMQVEEAKLLNKPRGAEKGPTTRYLTNSVVSITTMGMTREGFLTKLIC